MKLSHKARPTARDLAELHRHIGEAVEHLRGVVHAQDAAGRCLLTIGEQDKLVRFIDRLMFATYALEAQFERSVGGPAPAASSLDPSRWVRWLDERERVPSTSSHRG
jgi:hypothetical protein